MPSKRSSKHELNAPVIQAEGLVKTYNGVNAVDSIDLVIRRGEVFAFLGPNGAGKTTTVEIIETIRTPTKGKVQIMGMDIRRDQNKIKKLIGVLPQEFSSFDKLTVRETVSFYASLYQEHIDIDRLIEKVGLSEHSKKLYQNLSGGLKQRVGIAVSLVNDPKIVFLDEPTTGLDPRARQEVWKVIKDLKKSGKTIFLTTHYMEEAEELADHIAIINHGRIIAEGTLEELLEEHGSGQVLTFSGIDKRCVPYLREIGLEILSEDRGQVDIRMKEKEQVLGILELIRGSGVQYKGVSVRGSDLEEVFLSLTGEKLKEGEQ